MPDFIRSGQILTIGDKIRIEPGPASIQDIATEELLGPSTAAHYHAPRSATVEEIEDPAIDTPGGMVYAKDALGQNIEIGKPMTYLDWNAFKAGEPVYYLYRLDDTTPEERENTTELTIWREVGAYPTEEEAISAALSEGEI